MTDFSPGALSLSRPARMEYLGPMPAAGPRGPSSPPLATPPTTHGITRPRPVAGPGCRRDADDPRVAADDRPDAGRNDPALAASQRPRSRPSHPNRLKTSDVQGP